MYCFNMPVEKNDTTRAPEGYYNGAKRYYKGAKKYYKGTTRVP